MVKNDFWLTSGWHLLDQNDDGHLVPNEDFMRAYFYRPEVVPIEESCEAETDLHKKLIDKPFAHVEKKELNLIKDKDVIFNYEVILKFRDFLSNYPTLDAAYLAIARGQSVNFPPLFVDQMVQIILRENFCSLDQLLNYYVLNNVFSHNYSIHNFLDLKILNHKLCIPNKLIFLILNKS